MDFYFRKQISLILVILLLMSGKALGAERGCLSPRIVFSQAQLLNLFGTGSNIVSLDALKQEIKENNEKILAPGQDTGWVDIESINFPLKVIIKDSGKVLITFNKNERRRLFSQNPEISIYAKNEIDGGSSEVSGIGILHTGTSFRREDRDKDDFATIETQFKKHYLRIKNSGNVELMVLFEAQKNHVLNLQELTMLQANRVIKDLNAEYKINPIQANVIKKYLFNQVSAEKAAAFLLSADSRSGLGKKPDWISVLPALHVAARHGIGIDTAEKLIRNVWNFYEQFGTYTNQDYMEQSLEVMLIGEIPGEKFAELENRFSRQMQAMIEIIKMLDDYCQGKPIGQQQSGEWTIFDFLENTDFLGQKLDYEQRILINKFILHELDLEGMKNDPSNRGIAGMFEDIAYKGTDINPWRQQAERIMKKQSEEIEQLAKIFFIMFEADRRGIVINQVVLGQIIFNLDLIADNNSALYPMVFAVISKDEKKMRYPKPEQQEAYYRNVKTIIDDVLILAGTRRPNPALPAEKPIAKEKVSFTKAQDILSCSI